MITILPAGSTRGLEVLLNKPAQTPKNEDGTEQKVRKQSDLSDVSPSKKGMMWYEVP